MYHALFFTAFLYFFQSCSPSKSDVNKITELESGATIEVIADDFKIPSGITEVSENVYLVAERYGSLYRVQNGVSTKISGIPKVQFVDDGFSIYGSLMDVSLHPNFEKNQLVYISYNANDWRMKIARFRLDGQKAQEFEIIFDGNSFTIGSYFTWENDNHFFISFGVGGTPLPEPGAQDLNRDLGKIHRLKDNGSIPQDNPTFDGNEPGSIWSYGNRNPQGIFYDRETDILYANEHGPVGGDELNIIEKGKNYGWPLFSFGINYDGTKVSDMTAEEAAEFSELPFKHWGIDFRVAPSGLILLQDSNFEKWNGTFLMGSLAMQMLVRYDPKTDETEIVESNFGRVRDIIQLQDGNLLIAINQKSPGDKDKGRIIKYSLIGN